ncbi:MAG TPA: hypothetical protein PLQ36_04320, partial [Candidatus Gracilibacteria bacterium]|nr:hypothetical protein [Candidatus Gracilibacteria bacterium]
IPQAEITDTNFLESPQIDLEQLAIPSAKPQAEEDEFDSLNSLPQNLNQIMQKEDNPFGENKANTEKPVRSRPSRPSR